MANLYIDSGALIKPKSGNWVAEAKNIKGLYGGQEKALSYIINDLETRINNASFTPALSGTALKWISGSIPSSINSGETKTVTIQVFAKYNGDYYKDITSSLTVTPNKGTATISGTTLTITAPTVDTDTSVSIQFKYTEGSTTQTVSKSYTAKAVSQVTYYWYVGTEPITTSSTPGSGTVSAMTESTTLGWHNITGTPTEIQVGPTDRQSSNITWYIAIPDNLGITKATSGGLVDGTVTSTTMTLSDGIIYRVFTTAEAKKIEYLMIK